MHALLNVVRQQAAAIALDVSGPVRFATVLSYDPDNYRAKVALQPENIETGWLPIASPWVGNGWGMFAPPTPGDVVDVHFQEGDADTPYIAQRLFNNSARPASVQSGELWLLHKSGSYLKLKNDGKITLHSATEIDVGDSGASLKALVTDAFVSLFNAHTHAPGTYTSPSGPVTGASGTPSSTMGGSHTTSKLKAN